MRSLVYFIACTVDGYVAAHDGAWDFFGFEGPQVADLLRTCARASSRRR